MPVIMVNDQQYTLRPGPNRLGGGADADVCVAENESLGIQAIVDLAGNQQAVIRRHGPNAAVRVNGVTLVDPTPLMHGDKVEIAGQELFYSDDTKAGATSYVSKADVAALAQKRGGPARATAATGGRLVSLVDGKEYTIGAGGITIGRDASSAVVVAQNEVSRSHAEVAPVANGYEIRDLSVNGVYVNGTRVDEKQLLSRADIIRVGTEEFRFYADVPIAATARAQAPAQPVAPPRVKPPVTLADDRPILAVLDVMSDSPAKGAAAARHEVRVPLVHVGRGAHNDIPVNHDTVSDTHAKLHWHDDAWYVVDVGSTNGTFLAGQRITDEQKLEGDADLRFGGVSAKFRGRVLPADTGTGTRAMASIDRSKLRQPAAAVAAPVPAASVAIRVAETPVNRGVPLWVWGVAVLAIGAATVFFLLNR
jgi:pSer/pThr/pTyr-binding forkhead associated (FHA) protein